MRSVRKLGMFLRHLKLKKWAIKDILLKVFLFLVHGIQLTEAYNNSHSQITITFIIPGLTASGSQSMGWVCRCVPMSRFEPLTWQATVWASGLPHIPFHTIHGTGPKFIKKQTKESYYLYSSPTHQYQYVFAGFLSSLIPIFSIMSCSNVDNLGLKVIFFNSLSFVSLSVSAKWTQRLDSLACRHYVWEFMLRWK